MPATKEDIKRWFACGVREKATHLIVIYDCFDWSYHPEYIYKDGNARKRVEEIRNARNMLTVMEVYDLSKDMYTQLNEYRSFNF